ncbi:MAG: hypothetical protein AAGB00_13195 [Planctomycetota bacterium]
MTVRIVVQRVVLRQAVLPLAALGFCLAAGAVSATPTFEFSTVFGPSTPVGAQPSAANGALPDVLDAITNFGVANQGNQPAEFDGTPNLGGLAFVQNGPYYVQGNRAYGFAGPGRSDITFEPGTVEAVELLVRGSNSGDSSGGLSQTVPPNTAFDDSNVTVLVWSNLGIELEVNGIDNDAFQTIALDIGSIQGDSITRVSLINGTEAASVGPSALALIGQLTVTTNVPEPAAIGLVLAPAAGALLRRQRR